MPRKLFDPIEGVLHLADKENSFRRDVIQKCEEVNQTKIDLETIKKRPILRRRNAFFGERQPPIFFAIDDNRLYSGNFDCDHFSNRDLIKLKFTKCDV